MLILLLIIIKVELSIEMQIFFKLFFCDNSEKNLIEFNLYVFLYIQQEVVLVNFLKIVNFLIKN